MSAAWAWLVTVLGPAIARAHHPEEDETGLGSLALWIAPAVGLAVLALLQWIAVRRRRRDRSDDDPD
jgi:cytochrome c-type biogenesis protein CcmH/NrfF